MYKIRYFIETTRPKTLIASLAPICLSFSLNRSGLASQLPLVFSLLFSTLLIQILTNAFNDYYDLIQNNDTEMRIGPKRPFQRGDLSKQSMHSFLLVLTVYYIIALIPLLSKFPRLTLTFASISYLLAIFYTKGNYSLAKLGISDLFAFCFFGPIATMVSAYILTQSIQPIDFLIGCATGSLSTLLLIINHLRDEEEDKKTMKTTTVVRFGKPFAFRLIETLLFILSLIPLFFIRVTPVFFLIWFSIIAFNILFYLQFSLCTHPVHYGKLLPKTARLFLIQSFLYLGLILSSSLQK